MDGSEDQCLIRLSNYIPLALEAHVGQSVWRVAAMKRHTKCRTHVQREARTVLLAVTRAQRCLVRCLARVHETKATEAEVRNIRQQLVLVEQIIEAFNVAKSDAELSAATQRVAKLTALQDVPSLRLPNRESGEKSDARRFSRATGSRLAALES